MMSSVRPGPRATFLTPRPRCRSARVASATASRRRCRAGDCLCARRRRSAADRRATRSKATWPAAASGGGSPRCGPRHRGRRRSAGRGELNLFDRAVHGEHHLAVALERGLLPEQPRAGKVRRQHRLPVHPQVTLAVARPEAFRVEDPLDVVERSVAEGSRRPNRRPRLAAYRGPRMWPWGCRRPSKT